MEVRGDRIRSVMASGLGKHSELRLGVLRVRYPRGLRSRWLLVALPTLGLVILSPAPTPLARAGLFCRIGVLLLSSALVYLGVQLGLRRSTVAARRLLRASIVHVPLVFARGWRTGS